MGRGGLPAWRGPSATRAGVRRGPWELWECQPHTLERHLSLRPFAGSKPLDIPLFELGTLCLAPATLLHA